MSFLAFQAAHPPLSVPTDISLSQYLSIQEKGVSAWEFEATYDNHRVQVHDRTEISFPPMNQLESSVQTNLPMPKQQEVYYWEVKMFEKSPDTVVSVGVSTKPYPNTRLPGKHHFTIAADKWGKGVGGQLGGITKGQSLRPTPMYKCTKGPQCATLRAHFAQDLCNLAASLLLPARRLWLLPDRRVPEIG